MKSGASRYFTGEACRNGHINYRYTQSGTCVDCILGSTRPKTELPYMKKLEIFDIRIRHADIEKFLNVLFASAIMRDPAVRREDLRVAGKGNRLEIDGSRFHQFRCFPEDVFSMKVIGINMWMPGLGDRLGKGPIHMSRSGEVIG